MLVRNNPICIISAFVRFDQLSITNLKNITRSINTSVHWQEFFRRVLLRNGVNRMLRARCQYKPFVHPNEFTLIQITRREKPYLRCCA